MFSGIIKGIGSVRAYDESSSKLFIACPLFEASSPTLGSSIAIDGVCLTVSELAEDKTACFDLGAETRALTLLAQKRAQDAVNVELALLAGDPLDGHIVQGHVDTVATLKSIEERPDSSIFEFLIDEQFMPLVVQKGSIALNGVSLTINEVGENSFFVCLVPYTLQQTTFKNCLLGDRVHVETDILGRYVLNFMNRRHELSLAKDKPA